MDLPNWYGQWDWNSNLISAFTRGPSNILRYSNSHATVTLAMVVVIGASG